MFQNIKVDIIYYKTNTDFEMEFNLCGCCRMRLLTDKAPDKKTLVHQLARAVGRSKVILVAGNLFGDDGIIETVSRSISKNLSTIDNKLYGIESEDEIKIIDGAIPLVTRDGCLGGCIIESGPQTMILLSENKTIRKTVMNTLIHPYIEELCAADIHNAKTETEVPENTEVIEEETEPETEELSATEEIAEAEEIVNEDIQEESNDQDNTDTAEDAISTTEEETKADAQNTEETVALENFASEKNNVKLSGGMNFEEDDTTDFSESFVTEDEDYIEYSPEHNYCNSGYSYEDFFDDTEENSKFGNINKKGRFLASNLTILIISIILLVVFAVLCYCIFYIPSKDGVSATAFLQETFNTLFG